METSEITAYLLGARIWREATQLVNAGGSYADLGPVVMSPEETAAAERLGENRCLYWMQRGAKDSGA